MCRASEIEQGSCFLPIFYSKVVYALGKCDKLPKRLLEKLKKMALLKIINFVQVK